MLDPFQLIAAAIDSAGTANRLSPAEQDEYRGRRPGKRDGGFSLFRRRRDPEPPPQIPGAKAHVARLFQWLADDWLKVEPTRLVFGFEDSGLHYTPGRHFCGTLAANLFPAASTVAGRVDAAMVGEPVDIGEGRSLVLPRSGPLPTLRLQGDSILMRWATPAKVTQGRFTADLRGLTVWKDRGEVDVEWKALGLLDLAKNPVLWWGD